MGQTVAQQDQKHLGKILSLYKLIQSNSDEDTAAKIRELGRKSLEEEFSIAFCGHFSAGKSSMINRLIGDNILPSSPIPTSANLVRIRSGAEYAKVFFKQGGSRLYPAPYDYEAVKSYCKDGDQIQAIEISHNGAEFLEEAVIMDTPGIDSTDDAHRIATESALHLSDIVFYVMDYNHVQSELNFLFTKELTDAGKELYLIINQIDKHQDSELSFDQFKDSVETSFAGWGVKHSGIFYTSLRNEDSPHNQFKELREFIKDRKSKRGEILPVSIFRSMEKLADDHMTHLNQAYEGKLKEIELALEGISESERPLIQDKLDIIKAKMDQLKNDRDTDKEFSSGINDILKNAYLMPFETRSLAEAFLQASQPDFKVGLLFSKQKTEQERSSRLESFYRDMAEKVQLQLDWHIKDFLTTLFRKHEIVNPELLKAAQGFNVEFDAGLLKDAVKTGARLSGEYVLNYTNEVGEILKNIARRKLEPIKKLFIDNVKVNDDEELNTFSTEKEKLEILLAAWNEWLAIHDKLKALRREISEILYGDSNRKYGQDAYAIFIPMDDEPEIIASVEPADSGTKIVQTDQVPAVNDVVSEKHESKIDQYHEKQQFLVDKLEYSSIQIEEIPGLKKIARELKEKAGRLKEKEFTVALFGAFSAGKSSFANALVGERILPVSPNPTTAAINKIKPVTAKYPHGTVIVKIKESNALLKEIERSLGLFGETSSDFNKALQQINSLKWEDTGFSAVEKTHYAFLQAFAKGFAHFSNHLGEMLYVDLESFRAYVAEEDKSCFVEWIEVYYDCALTREGITLVDTPGADSINARHTGVAFDYIKNSDAILFVTYYNHAFSKADREFLIQLGRVKDTFELDKMFFIVNAVDLANSAEEQEAVLDYVEEQLIQYGIRKPHLYPVSSLLGLKSKLDTALGQDPLFNQFEQAFYSFITNDLMNMASDAAEAKWNQAVQLIEEMIISAEEDKASKDQKRKKLFTEQKEMLFLVSNKTSELIVERLAQEADELTFYIRRRVFIRFSEFFKESFNPTLLKEDGRNLRKALETALEELIESIGFDFSQELRATSLRIEAFIDRLLIEFQLSLFAEIKKTNKSFSLTLSEDHSLAGLEFETAFQDLDRGRFKKAMGMFKNPKAFFEKNEKKLMSDEVESQLLSPAGEYLEKENERLKNHYIQEMNSAFETIKNEVKEQIQEYFEGISSALDDNFSVEIVKASLEKIKNYQ
jgi:GTPase Era involved in 16S rRNA processing